MTQDVWVTSHPSLQPVASLHAQVKNEMAGITAAKSPAETVTAGAQREKSQNLAGLWHPLWRLRDKNSHALAVMLDPLGAVAQELL
jgi:hypothetical protein